MHGPKGSGDNYPDTGGEPRKTLADAAENLLDPYGESPFQDLADLQREVAVAWEGNLERRAHALDQDSYAIEVMNTERVRFNLNGRLNEALDKICRHGSWNRGIHNPRNNGQLIRTRLL